MIVVAVAFAGGSSAAGPGDVTSVTPFFCEDGTRYQHARKDQLQAGGVDGVSCDSGIAALLAKAGEANPEIRASSLMCYGTSIGICAACDVDDCKAVVGALQKGSGRFGDLICSSFGFLGATTDARCPVMAAALNELFAGALDPTDKPGAEGTAAPTSARTSAPSRAPTPTPAAQLGTVGKDTTGTRPTPTTGTVVATDLVKAAQEKLAVVNQVSARWFAARSCRAPMHFHRAGRGKPRFWSHAQAS